MENSYIVVYSEREKNEFCKYLKDVGYKWSDGKDVELNDYCFPVCVNTEEKSVSLTNLYLLKQYHDLGGEMLTVKMFANILCDKIKKVAMGY